MPTWDALGTARPARVEYWPLGLAIIASAAIACAIGVGIGLLTLRMAELYTTLVTLAFGLLMYEPVFDPGSFVNQGLGLPLTRRRSPAVTGPGPPKIADQVYETLRVAIDSD